MHVASGERLASREANFRDAKLTRDANEPQCFLEGEDVVPREPFLQFLRHAVGAALVAAIGDGDAQIRDAVAEAILHGRGYGGAFRESRWRMVEEAKSCGIASCDLELLDGTPLCFNLVTFWVPKPLPGGLTLSSARLDLSMKSRLSSWALLACIATGALVLSGCSTICSRIDANRAAFDQLPPQEQALVSQGRIQGVCRSKPSTSPGASLRERPSAWCAVCRPKPGFIPNSLRPTVPYGYGYGGFGYGWGGFAGPVGFYGRHGRFRYYGAFVDPYWNPYYYPFAATVSYPVKTVSFQRGRVVAFQYPHAQRLLRKGGRFPNWGVCGYALWTSRLTRSSTVTIPVNLRFSSKTAASVEWAARSRRMMR